MKKVFISQPMRGLKDSEILYKRLDVSAKLIEKYGEGTFILDTYFDDFDSKTKPLEYLAKSIEYLADADVVYFCKGWEKSRGCVIEQKCAVDYGIETIYEEVI